MVQQRVYILHSSLGARPGAESSAAGTKNKKKGYYLLLTTTALPSPSAWEPNEQNDTKNKKLEAEPLLQATGRAFLRHWFVQQRENGRSWRAVGGADCIA